MVMSAARQSLRAIALGTPVVLAALHPLVFIIRSHSTSHRFGCDVIARPAAIIAAVSLIVLLTMRAATGSLRTAAVAATFFFVVVGVFPALFTGEGIDGWLAATAFVLAALGVAAGLTRLLDGMAGVVVAWTLGVVIIWSAVSTYATSIAIWPVPPWREHVERMVARSASLTIPEDGPRPDIYYIVLDGMARSDVLESVYGLDTDHALEGFEELGFVIPSRSRSNYAQTQLSLASSLNMQYLDGLTSIMDEGADRRPLIRLIHQSGAAIALKRHGYELVVLKSGTSVGTRQEVQCRVTDLPPGPTELEHALLARMPGPRSRLHRAALRAHRYQVLRSFETLETVESDAPLFVVAHIVSPHPPFVLGPDGAERLGQQRFSFYDGDAFPGTRADYIDGYRAQVLFALARVKEAVERIIARSADAFIVIHADHGSGLGLVNADWERTDAFERLAIFSAYYAGGRAVPVPETMSPVNALRWVLRYGLGSDVRLLPDRSYLSDYLHPYQFVEVRPEPPSHARPSRRANDGP